MDSLRLAGQFSASQVTLVLIFVALKENKQRELNEFMKAMMDIASISLEYEKAPTDEQEKELVVMTNRLQSTFQVLMEALKTDDIKRFVKAYGGDANEVHIQPFSNAILDRQLLDAFWGVEFKKVTLYQLVEGLILAAHRHNTNQKAHFEKSKESAIGLFMALYFLYPNFIQGNDAQKSIYLTFSNSCDRVSVHHMMSRQYVELSTCMFDYFRQDCIYRYQSLKELNGACTKTKVYMRPEIYLNKDIANDDAPKMLLPSDVSKGKKPCKQFAPYELMVIADIPDVSFHIDSVLKDLRDSLRRCVSNRPKPAFIDTFKAAITVDKVEKTTELINALYKRIATDGKISLDISAFLFIEFRDFILNTVIPEGNEHTGRRDYKLHLDGSYVTASGTAPLNELLRDIDGEMMKRFFYIATQFGRLRFYNSPSNSNNTEGYAAYWVKSDEPASKFEDMLNQYSILQSGGNFERLIGEAGPAGNALAPFQKEKMTHELHDKIMLYDGDTKPKFVEKSYAEFLKMYGSRQ